MKQTPILVAATLGAIGLMFTATNANAESCDTRRPAVTQTNWNYSNSYNKQTRYSNVRYSNQRAERRLAKKRKRMIRRLMNRLDWNNDGYISRREARRSHDLKRKFHRIDRNGDGYVCNRELNRHLRRIQRRSLARILAVTSSWRRPGPRG